MGTRDRLLQEWSRYILRAAYQGALTGRPCPIRRVEGIAGPRAGALEMQAGLEAGRLLKALNRDDAAVLRQFIPWPFAGEPMAYMAGRFVRVEAGWPDRLAETLIRLGDLGSRPRGNGRWIAGKNECGATIIAGLNDRTPHYLVSGATGSGKSVALRAAVLQLSHDPTNHFVLIDGKYGESLRQIGHLQGIVGPVAVEGPDVQAALGWACVEMRRRYEAGVNGHGRVVVVFDEIQEFVGDPVVTGLMAKLAGQGRAAGVHLIAATQHPTVAAFGDASTRRNLTGKLALRVSDPDASRVAVGGRLPRADHLLGAGDCYTVAPGAIYRVQMAYVDGQEIDAAPAGQRNFDEWPTYQAEEVGQDLPDRNIRALQPEELGASLIAAMEGEGRPALKARIEEAGLARPGSDWARRLLDLGRETLACLERWDVGLCYLTAD
ncbi:MAG: hypothetical protein AMJ81_06115 [Phycisphaerae bacterium SM23_33]|nr:MAG: hypothetical protein AMJ81_06115 [Phycisphaerae bacterium SM23_33]